MFDKDTLVQVGSYFAPLKREYTLLLKAQSSHPSYNDAKEMIEELASTSEKLSAAYEESENFRIDLLVDGTASGISFRGIPGGHEFTSLLLSILNHDGIGKNLPDDGV
ncbi:MAG: alkyl hydroperoxide reductase subunit F, partial [Porphyromonas sp.]|nr:alkyl hydroperoxide reductase subunit F [Porphyromonas sp.]